jgi:hypothetical protein
VRRADASAGEHRDGHLGDHRQVDPDHVAAAHPQRPQRIGEALHVGEQLRVGDVALPPLLAPPVQGHAIPTARQHVAVKEL